jgi:hypothetical protein
MIGTRQVRQVHVCMAVAALLTLVSSAWGQQQDEIGPLNLSGNLGFGYSALSTNDVSSSSPMVTGDADLMGYWRDPRILFYELTPFAGYGDSVTNASDLVNRGKGFTAATTVLGGSPVPVTVTYSRLWQDYPGFSTTGNILSGVATSFNSSDLGIDWGLYWGKLPPISFHYGRSSNETDLPAVFGNSGEVHTNVFSVNSHYSLAGWNLDGGYNRNNLDALRIDLLNLAGPTQPETSHSDDLHASAQRSLPLNSHLTLTGGQRQWDDNTVLARSDSDYYYARALANSHPVNRLSLNFTAGYTSNETAAAIQQVLGQSTSAPGSTLFGSGHTVDFGGGAQVVLPRGFAVSGDASGGRLSNPLGLSEEILAWDAALSYLHRLGHSGSLTASYTYQDAETDGATSTTKTLRAAVSSLVPYQVQLTASMHYDQSEFENVVPLSPTIASPGHGYGLVLNAGRPLSAGWRISGDFELDHHLTEFPLNVTVTSKSFGIRADSSAWELLVRRSYHSGLALQIGNSLVFVNNPGTALLTPLGTALLDNSNVQTMIVAAFRPGSKRLRISGSYTRFGYDNAGVNVTNATLFNGTVSYRLRRLTVQTGFRYSNSHVFSASNPSFHRWEVYFEVLRHFHIL